MNIPELAAQIIAKAEAEPVFRQALITNPRGAIGELAGLAMPEDLEITVFQETLQHRCLVLPPVTSDELSDADLATVAGGKENDIDRRSRELSESLRKDKEGISVFQKS